MPIFKRRPRPRRRRVRGQIFDPELRRIVVDRRLRRAERSVARGRLDIAIAHYFDVLAATPENPRHLNRAGDLLARAGHREESIVLFLKVARLHADEGFVGKARAIYRKILRLDPAHAEARDRLAEIRRVAA